MHFRQIKGRSLCRGATATISKGPQLKLLLCGLLGIASVLLVAGETLTSPNATTSNLDERSGDQVNRKTPPKRMGFTKTSSGSVMKPLCGSRSAPWSGCCPFVQRRCSSLGSGNGFRTFWRSLRNGCGGCRGFLTAFTQRGRPQPRNYLQSKAHEC